MAKKTVEIYIELEDYFSKFGFGDGDDTAALNEGYHYREAIVAKFNELFKAKGLRLRAYESTHSSIHNDCQIDIFILDRNGNRTTDCFEPYNQSWDELDKVIGKFAGQKFGHVLSDVEHYLESIVV